MEETAKNEKDARMWGMFCHLSALSGMVGVPLGGILGPLIIWLIKREEIPFVNDQGKEALNFQLSFTIYFIVAGILVFALVGLLLLPLLAIVNLVYVIIASVKANEGIAYRYPFTIRFFN